MRQYLDLMQHILDHGDVRMDRTGTGTKAVFGYQMRFNLADGFPAVTTKVLAWKSMVSELLWFIEGSGDERRLCEILHGTRDASKSTIWTANANMQSWKPHAKFEGDCGKIYGYMWRRWPGPAGEVDQLENLIAGIKKDPCGRRHIISAWNPGEIENTALPPCHVMAQFFVCNNKLSCQLYQRSCDVPLGTPFNIASYALLTHMIAQVCGLDVGDFVYTLGDAHIYLNQLEDAKIQLQREPKKLPQLELNPLISCIDDFLMNDIKLVDYVSHEAIKYAFST